MKIYYLVYKLTNMVNGKIYIGCHMTKNQDDSYMGSGRRIGYAKQKYGIENFKKEILSSHETPEEMLAEEARLVNEDFLGRDDVYNLACGGRGSWFIVNKNYTKEQRIQCTNASNNSPKRNRRAGIAKSIITKRQRVNLSNGGNPGFKSKHHSEKTRKQISISMNGKQTGDKNSQYGTCWIFSVELKTSKKIKVQDAQEYIKNGWRIGRKIKF